MHMKMNIEKRPCKQNSDYSFSDCVKKFIAEKIGCRSPWDSFGGFENCTTVNQLIQFEAENEKIQGLEQRETTEYTGCPLPCQYQEFSLVGSPGGRNGT